MEQRNWFYLSGDADPGYFCQPVFRNRSFLIDSSLIGMAVISDLIPLVRYWNVLPLNTFLWCGLAILAMGLFWMRPLQEFARINRVYRNGLPTSAGAVSSDQAIGPAAQAAASLIHLAILSLVTLGLAVSEQTFALGHSLRP